MIQIPYGDIIAKIKEKTSLGEEELDSRVKKKLEQLSGLISKEGAAHIVANELGVKIFEKLSGKLKIKDILAGMRDVETTGKVTQVFEVREFNSNGRQGKVGNLVIGDETGSIRVVCWGNQADIIKNLSQNNIVKIVSGYVRENQGRKEVHLNDRSKLIINPAGESIGEVASVGGRIDAKRLKISELSEGNDNTELLGTIVNVFEPKFFEVCPTCNKRARQRENLYVCETHGAVTPDYSYVLNFFLDDGSDNIRVVCFRNQAERLLSMNKEQMLQFKDTPIAFEEVKNTLLGNMVKIVGRVTKNTMFDRLEFISQLVYINPNPEEELQRLQKETSETKPKAEESDIDVEELE
jgi:replication factor A1